MEFKVDKTAKPFIKWVGGKTQLLSDIAKALPVDFARKKEWVYVEPFVGGGAVLLWMLQQFPNIKRAVINDINPHLMVTYRVVKEDPNSLISLLRTLQGEYLSLPENQRKQYYLDKRSLYNTSSLSNLETAALFIFLNRTCFNGLYRVNSKGLFNVPYGRYSNPKICNEDNLQEVSKLLQRVELLNGDFSNTGKYAGKNTFFYFDPPYKPISKTSSFNSYSKEDFGDEEQIRLSEFCHEVARKKSAFILSNSDVKTQGGSVFFDQIYDGYNIQRVLAARLINAVSDKRGKLSEMLIRNYDDVGNCLYKVI